jgi:ribosome-binding protein aMBF1 (putative translation factor)
VTPYRVKRRDGLATKTESVTAMAAKNRMKAARVLKGLAQLQLAGRVGTKEIEISRFETGRACPDSVMKRRLSEALGKPSFEIFHC